VDHAYLHRYLVPTATWADAELLAHRRRVTEESPSLPHCAGRALATLRQAIAPEIGQPLVPVLVPANKRHVVVHAVARPEVDAQAMSRALLRAVRDHDSAA
jgi:hypothetical protein